MPTRTLPDGYDVPRKFANAVPATAAALLDAYEAAAAASAVAMADLDALAVTVSAPSRILGFARAAARLGPDRTAALTLDAEAGAGAGAGVTSVPDAGAALMADAGAERRPDGLPARADQLPEADRRELASPPPGPAELAVRRHRTPDLGLLMRARVIDKAMRALIREVKNDRGRSRRGRADGGRRPAGGG